MMEDPISARTSISSHSSNSSLSSDALKTPCDPTNPSPPDSFQDQNMPHNLLSSRLEMVPKRASTTPMPGLARPYLPAGYTRTRRTTNASVSSAISTASNHSLLRATLRLASSSTSSSRPSSIIAWTPSTGDATPIGSQSGTSSLLTGRSSSSIASTTLSSSPFGSGLPSALANRRDPTPRVNVDVNVVPIVSSFTAEPTTALSPSTSPSLAQFTPTPTATSSLLRYGIPSSQIHSSAGTAKLPEVSRQRSRDRSHSRNNQIRDRQNKVGNRHSSLPSRGIYDEYNATSSSSGKVPNVPQISRALEPESSILTGIDIPCHYGSGPSSSRSLNPRHIKPTDSSTSKTPTQACAFIATPRPPFPIAQTSPAHQQKEQVDKMAATQVLTMVDKGKGRAFAPHIARASTLPVPRHTTATAHTFFDTLPKAQRSILQPPSVKPPKPAVDELPTLASIESNSRLMRSKIVCSTCGEVGPDFPKCGRCEEAWCSRECRLRANSVSATGKHKCAASVA